MKAICKFQNKSEKTGAFSRMSLLLSLFLSTTLLPAQNGPACFKTGISAGVYVSGNAHGAIYDVSATLYNGKHLFSLGPCIQNRKPSICGLRFGYSYVLTGQDSYYKNRFEKADECSRFQLLAFTKSQYITNGYLSKTAVRNEEAYTGITGETNNNAAETKLSTLEACFGFGLNYKITKKLVWSNFIGFGAYYHLNYNNPMYTEKAAPVITLGTSLALNYFKD